MLFSSTVFLFLFLPIVLLLYYNPFMKNNTFRNVLLLFASLVFYTWGEPVYILLMLFSILLTYIFGLWIAHVNNARARKCVLVSGIVYHVAVLVVFKYLSFLLSQFSLLFGGGGKLE